MPSKPPADCGSASASFGLRTKAAMAFSPLGYARVCQQAESGKAAKAYEFLGNTGRTRQPVGHARPNTRRKIVSTCVKWKSRSKKAESSASLKYLPTSLSALRSG